MCRFAIDDTTVTTVIGAPKVKNIELRFYVSTL